MGGFSWDGESYTESSGGEFVDKKLFKKLVANDTTVYVVGIREGISNYQGNRTEQWLVDFTVDGDETFTKGLGKGNEERDDRFERIRKTIEETSEPLACRFVEIGKRFDIGRPVEEADA